ncbi:MAG TPA: electron transport complex subunit RsxB [Gammaproteobacteria bacterium]
MLTAILIIAALALAFGLLLGFAAVKFRVNEDPVVDRIDALLPQTQCGQCGYPGCRPYAEAIANDEADINQCPPGGEDGVRALAELLDREPKPVGARFGIEKPKALAVIDEQTCIGCTLCIQACPVDAIIGAAKQMHTVLESECTGCELCIAPCPVDCIRMVPPPVTARNWKWPEPETRLDEEPAHG